MASSGFTLDAGRLLMLREVALRGTIAAAARSLGLTPSAVSQQVAVLERDADVALVDEYDYVPLALPDYLLGNELCAEKLVVVSAPGVLGQRSGVSLASLMSEDWVMPPDDAACGLAVRSACRAAGFEPRVRWETDDLLLLVRAVAAGHGIAVLPRLAVVDGIADVDVRPLRSPPLRRRITAVTRSSASSRPVVES